MIIIKRGVTAHALWLVPRCRLRMRIGHSHAAARDVRVGLVSCGLIPIILQQSFGSAARVSSNGATLRDICLFWRGYCRVQANNLLCHRSRS